MPGRDFDGSTGWLGDQTSGWTVPSISGSNPMTVGAWIRPDTTAAGVRAIFSRYDSAGGTAGYELVQSGDELQFIRRGNTPVTTTGINLSSGAWQFVAVRAVTNGANSDLKFVKFTAAGSKTNVNTSDNFNNYAAGNRLAVGAQDNGPTSPFNGGIAWCGVWVNEELTDDELWAYAIFGPWVLSRDTDCFIPVYGVASPEPDLTGSGGTGQTNGTCPVITADMPPIACPFPQATHAGAA